MRNGTEFISTNAAAAALRRVATMYLSDAS